MRITVEALAHPDQFERIAENLAKVVHVVWVQARKERRRTDSNVRYPIVRKFR